MANERKYGDEEVKEIFDLAVRGTESERLSPPNEHGLTLAELQEVGREVGVDPSRIADAAMTLATRREVLPRRTSLGMPISVARVIELPRAVTDREWDVLVSEFRETFGARGKVMSHGGVREWSNGNLHAYLEPTATGHRLRLSTLKGGAKALNRIGLSALALGLMLITVFLTSGVSPVRMEVFTLLAVALGVGTLASNQLTLPEWAREREGQMEHLAARVATLITESPEDGDSRT